MTYRKFWYYWHTRNDSDSRNGWNTSHSGHSGSWYYYVQVGASASASALMMDGKDEVTTTKLMHAAYDYMYM